MNTKIYFLYNGLFGYEFPVQEGEDPPVGDPPSGDPPKSFTQEQVNKILADERRKSEEKANKKITELQDKLKGISVSDEDRKALEQQLEHLRGEKESTEQSLTRQIDEIRKESEKTTKKLSEESNSWKTRFSDSVLNSEILNAAVEHKAFGPDQIIGILKGLHKIELREGIGPDNKPNGKFEGWVVGFKDIDPDKKEITLDLRIPDAIKRMRELPQRFGNLFRTDANSGIQMGPNVDVSDTAPNMNDPVAYRKWAEKNPKLVGRR